MNYDEQCKQAAEAARTNPGNGTSRICEIFNAAPASDEMRVIDAARRAGFNCEYWPHQGAIALKVTWPKKGK
jgi:hypothetical protein